MTVNDRQEPPTWGTPAEEYRAMAKDAAEMGGPDFAIQFLALAAQEERKAQAFHFTVGRR